MALGGDVAKLFAVFYRLSEAEKRLSAVAVKQEADFRDIAARCGVLEQRLSTLETRFGGLSREIAAEAKAAASSAAHLSVGSQLGELAAEVAILKRRLDETPRTTRKPRLPKT
jgi:uncharacterized protein YceH (UPF0502 family)